MNEYLVKQKNKPRAGTEWLRVSDLNSSEIVEDFENTRVKTKRKT